MSDDDLPGTPKSPDVAPAASAESTPTRSAPAFLDLVRAQSCYPKLRDFITVLYWILVVVGLVWGAVLMISYSRVLTGILIGAGSLVLATAWKHLAGLAADAADLLVEIARSGRGW